MANNLDDETKEATMILVHWYGSMASNWTITERTVTATAKLLGGTSECGDSFKLVPTPSGAFTGAGIMGNMAFNYAKDTVKRAVIDNTYYNSCIKSQALYRRSEVQGTTY